MKADEFTFVLTADGGTSYPATNAAAAEGKPGAVTFDPITFDTPGTYQYTLAEQPGASNVGIDYDTDTYTVTADVKDNGQGDLEVTWSINGTQDKTVAFENSYKANPTSMSFGATKMLAGRDLTEGEFTFQVTNEAGDKVYTRGTNDAAGTVNFGSIQFVKAGTYSMWISEVLPEDDDPATAGVQNQNVTYDETRYQVNVTVKDNRKGGLEITQVDWSSGSPVFENTYSEPEEPSVPGDSGNTGDNGGKLVETSDPTLGIVAGVAIAGVVLVAGGYAVSRRRGE